MKRRFPMVLKALSVILFASTPIDLTMAQDGPVVLNHLATKNGAPIYTLIRQGAGRNNVVQSHTFDEKGGYIYSLNVTKKGGEGPAGVINRYAMQGPENVAVDFSLPSTLIGHQGLAAEQSDGDSSWLWSSEADDKNVPGTSVLRFRYVPGEAIQDVEKFRVFDSGKSDSPTPTICSGEKYLVVKQNNWTGAEDKRAKYTVRVFDLAKMKSDGPGDYSHKFVYEWRAGGEAAKLQADLDYRAPLQSIACDSKRVYILYGTARTKYRNVLSVFTLDGRYIGANGNVTIGKKESRNDGAGQHYESESIAFVDSQGGKALTYGVASGDAHRRIYRIYDVNGLPQD